MFRIILTRKNQARKIIAQESYSSPPCPVPQEVMLDHALRTVSFIADIGDVLVLMARQPPEEHHTQEVLKPSQILASVGTAQTDHKNIKITCHVFQAPEVCSTKIGHFARCLVP